MAIPVSDFCFQYILVADKTFLWNGNGFTAKSMGAKVTEGAT